MYEPPDPRDDEPDEPELMGPILDEPELMREMIAAALERDPRMAYLAPRLRAGRLAQDDWPKITAWLDRQS